MDIFLFSKIIRPLLTISNLFIILIILLFFIRNKKNYFKFFLKLSFFLYLIIGILPIGNILQNEFLEKNFVNKKNSTDFDSILVLSGDETRYLKAVKLHKINPKSKIIFTGGSGQIVSKDGNEEVKKFEFLINNIIDKDSVIILKNSRNTIENFKNFKNANSKLGFTKTILVTSPGHYKRSLLIAKKLDLKFVPYYHQSFRSFSIINYYQNYSFSRNWSSFDIFILELLGILRVYLIKI